MNQEFQPSYWQHGTIFKTIKASQVILCKFWGSAVPSCQVIHLEMLSRVAKVEEEVKANEKDGQVIYSRHPQQLGQGPVPVCCLLETGPHSKR